MLDPYWVSRFSETFARPASAVTERIWARVYGDEYPAGLGIHSYLSVTELEKFDAELRLAPGALLVDAGCGRGGPGLWVAARTGARLLGVDIAEPALASARERAAALGLGERAEYRVGSFDALGLPDASARAAMSVDALLFAEDKASALREFARVLEPGGRLCLTTWDYHSQPVGRPPQVPDHRPLLEAAGFTVREYAETEAWRERQARTTELLLDEVEELAAESGRDPAELRSRIEEMKATNDCMIRRVFLVAEREGSR
ncbi:class I SAM-dependent methyltransferase [Amycolatopsis anabasis]|uniref:class I SAM-dependent methyltransferase n=1 Tax=Amycolatopsis anabasis TaxID=1840409 RepID=UPI001FE459E0|nr:class I SAM-dependent methyltransferase [Amycolatopsis anabasis]